MELETKFGIGDEVWNVWDRPRREVEKCSVCGAAGKVRVLGSEELVSCPKCYGKGEAESGETYVEHVVVHAAMTVGKVTVAVEGPTYGDPGRAGATSSSIDTSNMGPRSYKREETYMCVETGVGSGRVYHAHNLFATRAEAEAEAAARTASSLDSIRRYDVVG